MDNKIDWSDVESLRHTQHPCWRAVCVLDLDQGKPYILNGVDRKIFIAWSDGHGKFAGRDFYSIEGDDGMNHKSVVYNADPPAVEPGLTLKDIIDYADLLFSSTHTTDRAGKPCVVDRSHYPGERTDFWINKVLVFTWRVKKSKRVNRSRRGYFLTFTDRSDTPVIVSPYRIEHAMMSEHSNTTEIGCTVEQVRRNLAGIKPDDIIHVVTIAMRDRPDIAIPCRDKDHALEIMDQIGGAE